MPAFAEFQRFEGIVAVWLACSAAADTLITGSLVWHLVSRPHCLSQEPKNLTGFRTYLKRKHKSGFTGSDDAVDRIIRCACHEPTSLCLCLHVPTLVTVQTGMVTAVCAIIDLITFLSVVSIFVSV